MTSGGPSPPNSHGAAVVSVRTDVARRDRADRATWLTMQRDQHASVTDDRTITATARSPASRTACPPGPPGGCRACRRRAEPAVSATTVPPARRLVGQQDDREHPARRRRVCSSRAAARRRAEGLARSRRPCLWPVDCGPEWRALDAGGSAVSRSSWPGRHGAGRIARRAGRAAIGDQLGGRQRPGGPLDRLRRVELRIGDAELVQLAGARRARGSPATPTARL